MDNLIKSTCKHVCNFVFYALFTAFLFLIYVVFPVEYESRMKFGLVESCSRD